MAKESPDIWMPLYIGDYLSKTMHLSTLESGCYLHLLMAYWKNGGPISCQDRKLAAICRIPLSEFSAIRSALEEFFVEENGLWKNPRADREISKWGQMKDDRGYGAALSNFKKFGTPIPEKYAERYAERDAGHNADTPLSVTPSPSPSSLPATATKTSKTGVRFAPPTISEVASYFGHRKNGLDAVEFIAYYEARGWKLKGVMMVSWKAAVITWEKNKAKFGGSNGTHRKTRAERLDAGAADFGQFLENLGNPQEASRGTTTPNRAIAGG